MRRPASGRTCQEFPHSFILPTRPTVSKPLYQTEVDGVTRALERLASRAHRFRRHLPVERPDQLFRTSFERCAP